MALHGLDGQSDLSDLQWEKLKKSILARAVKKSPSSVFGDFAANGTNYRWGMATAMNGPCGELLEVLSRFAVDQPAKQSWVNTVDLPTSVEVFIDSISGGRVSTLQCAISNVWAAALPSLVTQIDSRLWWDLLGSLQQLRESSLQLSANRAPQVLMLGGELGLTLAWRLADVPSCYRMRASALTELERWFVEEGDALSDAVTGSIYARLVMASLMRCQILLQNTQKCKLKKRQLDVAQDLAVWVAAMTMHNGTSAFSRASKQDVRDDTSKYGLLRELTKFDPESLEPAISAALGESRSHGKLAWQISLPESMQHCDTARVAVMLPEWDVRRGRMHVDYAGEDVRLEVFHGRRAALLGDWQTLIEVDGEEQQAKGDWTLTCEFSDDDVHYLELEQPWSGEIVLQRHLLLIRNDRCVMLADAVIHSKPILSIDANVRPRRLRYTSRLPLASDITIDEEPETREIFLVDKKRQAMVIPLSANEWRVGPSSTKMHADGDQLVLDATGTDALYAPVWIDFESSRFKRPRTWRQLTIADELRIVRPDEAAGYRIQCGSEQWMVYRSLGARRCRSLLGKHLIADFFVGQFFLEDGSVEELVTVDDTEAFDDTQ